ncbi:hypothetical protein G5V59_18735 [Nocardioides sp. W3-2-3]|uniref:hypothetical protein n=1 Tax=Nocardioides convexus TaxID=2712224 RepID=UPI00241899E7|nr:hypothetical protein [Nocardioides convexus]NHA01198.1 hypothetical protein [Nocardioides convexus]
MTTPTHPTLGQRLTGLAAALAVLGIVLGLPALFLAIGASPIPDQAPTLDGIKNALLAPDDGTLVLGLFKVIGWVAWAFMTLSLIVEVLARLRRVQAPQAAWSGQAAGRRARPRRPRRAAVHRRPHRRAGIDDQARPPPHPRQSGTSPPTLTTPRSRRPRIRTSRSRPSRTARHPRPSTTP